MAKFRAKSGKFVKKSSPTVDEPQVEVSSEEVEETKPSKSKGVKIFLPVGEAETLREEVVTINGQRTVVPKGEIVEVAPNVAEVLEGAFGNVRV